RVRLREDALFARRRLRVQQLADAVVERVLRREHVDLQTAFKDSPEALLDRGDGRIDGFGDGLGAQTTSPDVDIGALRAREREAHSRGRLRSRGGASGRDRGAGGNALDLRGDPGGPRASREE